MNNLVSSANKLQGKQKEMEGKPGLKQTFVWILFKLSIDEPNIKDFFFFFGCKRKFEYSVIDPKQSFCGYDNGIVDMSCRGRKTPFRDAHWNIYRWNDTMSRVYFSIVFVAVVLKKLRECEHHFFLHYKSYYSPVAPYLSCVQKSSIMNEDLSLK